MPDAGTSKKIDELYADESTSDSSDDEDLSRPINYRTPFLMQVHDYYINTRMDSPDFCLRR